MKPDFDRLVLCATNSPDELHAGGFSWSAARHTLFLFCERAYFLRYYAAQGGWNRFSSYLAAQAFEEKYLLFFEDYLSAVALDSLAKSLAAPAFLQETEPAQREKTLVGQFKYHVSRHLFLALPVLRNGEYRDDPKRLSFFDFYYGTGRFASPDDLLDRAREEFRRFFEFLSASGLSGELAAVEQPAWRLPPSFRPFPLMGVEVFPAPVLFQIGHGAARTYGFDFRDHAGEPAEPSLADSVFASFIQTKYPGHRPETVRTTLRGTVPRMEEFTPSPLSPAFVSESIGKMTEKTAGREFSVRDFPPRKERTQCGACRFSGACALLDRGKDD